MTRFFSVLLFYLSLSNLLPAGDVWAQSISSAEVELADYQVVTLPEGTLSSTGSDSLANLILLWAEEFKRYYPQIDIQIQSFGSSTAPPALVLEPAGIGPMSRLMNEEEVQGFELKTGYKPIPIAVAIDALAIFVHPENPLPGLTMAELDAIFSRQQTCGAAEPIRSWGQLSLTGSWSGQPIKIFGRNPASGTHQYFRLHALCNGEFQSGVTERPGSASVIQAVSRSPFSIGYAAMGYTTDKVRVLPIARLNQQEFVDATRENAVNGSYPLARLLYIYVNHDPALPWDPVSSEFIRMSLSRQGQALVTKAGFAPLPVAVANRELKKLITIASDTVE